MLCLLRLQTFLFVYYYSREHFNSQCKRVNWQTSKMYLASSKWTDKPFLLAFLFPQFCQVYPPDPDNRKSNRVLVDQKSCLFIGTEWNLELATKTLTLTPTSPGGPGGPSFPFRPNSPLSPVVPSGPASPFSPWEEWNESNKKKKTMI